MLLVFLLEFVWLASADSESMPAFALVAGDILFRTLIPALVGTFLIAAAHILMADELLGKSRGLSDAIGEVRRCTPSLLQAGLVAGTGAMFFGIFPGLIFLSFVWWGPPILGSTIVLERRAFPDAWTETRRRLRGNLGRVVLVVLMAALGLVIVSFVVLVPIAFALQGLGTTGDLATYVAVAVMTALLRPAVAAATLRLYFDARARSEEGFDGRVLERDRAERPEGDETGNA
ncbi:MAG: hypothetical protein ACRDJB_10215 [Actinomycetota bacterium]